MSPRSRAFALSHLRLATVQIDIEGNQRAEEKNGGTGPQNHRTGLKRRVVEHKVAVAVDHVLDDFFVGAAGIDLLDHLIAQIDGKFRIGVGNRLILANEAAQLLGNPQNALVSNRVIGRRNGFLGLVGNL